MPRFPTVPLRRRPLPALALAALALLGAGPSPAEEPDPFRATLTPAARRYADRVLSPSVYRIDFTLDPDFLTFSGRETIDLTNRSAAAWNEIYLHVYPNAKFVAEEDTRNIVVQAAGVDGQEVAFTLDGTLLRLPLPKPLRPRATARVHVVWKGILPRSSGEQKDLMAQGMDQLGEMLGQQSKEKSGDYGLYACIRGTLNMAMWYPALATFENTQGWDTKVPTGMGDFGFFETANYEVSLTVPKEMQIACTGMLVAEEDKGGGLVTRTYRAGFVRDFVVQMSRKYARASRVVDGTTVNSWYLPGDEEGGKKVLQYAADALALYNRMYGPYPWLELDLVEANLKGGAGGVEFPGCVTINSQFYPKAAAASGAGGKLAELMQQFSGAGAIDVEAMLEFTVVHEVSHQWWNSTVGSDSQTYPFIDEALANCTSAIYFEKLKGEEAAKQAIQMNLKAPFQMMGMFGGQDMPVLSPTAAFKSSIQYSAIVYGKGALYLLELRKRVGVGAWEAGAQEYFRSRYFLVAQPKDFTDAVARAAGRQAEVDALYRRWILETHGVEDIGGMEGSIFDNPLLKELLGNGGGGGADAKEIEEMLQELLGGTK
ncbi:MAG: M1 family metallopeptidase [Planctomycetes bacterium]|nr:M1 family metallopeptidase [Planctomycetota bacterium]